MSPVAPSGTFQKLSAFRFAGMHGKAGALTTGYAPGMMGGLGA
jgi:hypothetical protein